MSLPILELSLDRLHEDRGALGAPSAGELQRLADPRRVFGAPRVTFFCRVCGGQGATGYNLDDECPACLGKGRQIAWETRPDPVDPAMLRWMLSDPARLDAAEALARACVAALSRWGAPQPDKVCWGRAGPGFHPDLLPVVWESPVVALTRAVSFQQLSWDDRCRGRGLEEQPWWRHARKLRPGTLAVLTADVAGAVNHRRAVEASEEPAPVDPYEPLLRLWELGVVLEQITEGEVVLEPVSHRCEPRTWSAGTAPGAIDWPGVG